ncbi:MAG TPA: methyl-accepting chemotaxis protein [Usitatibacter sp.]|nr:methyl-accepting chemotaxis protein [Usitatibacter sp.]
MSSASLQVKLLALVAFALGLPLAAALVSLDHVYRATRELERISREDFHAQEAVALATIGFKQQVQEWKNVLLRGHDPSGLAKYWASFQKAEKEVVAGIAEARAGIAYEDLRARLDEFTAAHRAAGERYRAGLQAFTAAGHDPRAGDKAVAGIDRAPTELLVEAERVARERGAAAVKAAVDGARRAYQVSVAVTLAVVAASLVALWLFVRRAVVDPVREAMRFARRIAQGDLTGSIAPRSGDEVGQLIGALQQMNEALSAIVRQMRAAAESVAVASGQVAAGTTALSQQTEEQASSIEETAASMEELAATVSQNAANARKGDELARGASDIATAGGAEVAAVVATMGDMSASAKRIADIVSVIDSIAFQTNILALNAAVEAARAGTEGRGFAVVAAEVRTLAHRSASAAREIKELIGASVAKVDDGTALVERAGATIDKLVADVKSVTGLMRSIAEASAEQSRGVQQVTRTVTEMDKVVQHNASAVQESAAAAEEMRQQSEEMLRAVKAFRLPSDDAAEAEPAPRLVHRPAAQRRGVILQTSPSSSSVTT